MLPALSPSRTTAAAVATSTTRSPTARAMASVMYTNAVYFPNHRIYQGDTPGMLNYRCISHVFYACASVSPDGRVFLSDEWVDARAPVDGVHGGLGSLRCLKRKHPHLLVILSVGGASTADTFPLAAGDDTARDKFACSALELLEASGLDGLDIAWEYPHSTKQGSDFVSLLSAVRVRLPHDHFVLTAALPANPAIIRDIDLEAAATHLDYINLRAYDFFGLWSPRSGHHAQLYAMSRTELSGSSGVTALMARGFPASKILLGIPTHARSFVGASGPGQLFRDRGDEGVLDYGHLPEFGGREVVDRRRIAAQCVGGDGGFLTYDNADTVVDKAGFCKQKGLAGLFYWNAPADSKDKSRSLIAAGFRALHTL